MPTLSRLDFMLRKRRNYLAS